jgi:hypothetical protein
MRVGGEYITALPWYLALPVVLLLIPFTGAAFYGLGTLVYAAARHLNNFGAEADYRRAQNKAYKLHNVRVEQNPTDLDAAREALEARGVRVGSFYTWLARYAFILILGAAVVKFANWLQDASSVASP